MRFIACKLITSRKEAVRLVLQETDREDMAEEALELFLVDNQRLQTEDEKSIDSEVQRKYGHKARWYHLSRSPWLVPWPQLRYDVLPDPHLTITIQPYLVASLEVLINRDSYSAALVGLIGKPEKLQLPMVFLQAILDNTVEGFPILAKDGVSTTWRIPSLSEPLTLPDDLVEELSWTLQRKSVVTWLLSFGTPGRSMAPQVAGCLLGLQFQGSSSKSLPLTGQVWKEVVVRQGLVGMFGTEKAKEKFKQGSPFLKPTMDDAEALRIILEHSQ
jgi:hypothetical protein